MQSLTLSPKPSYARTHLLLRAQHETTPPPSTSGPAPASLPITVPASPGSCQPGLTEMGVPGEKKC